MRLQSRFAIVWSMAAVVLLTAAPALAQTTITTSTTVSGTVSYAGLTVGGVSPGPTLTINSPAAITVTAGSPSSFIVGSNANPYATVIQNGGSVVLSNTANGQLYLGVNTGTVSTAYTGSASYTLNAGTITLGGTAAAEGLLGIGASSDATFTQNGGSITAYRNNTVLFIGAGGNGSSYSITSGTFEGLGSNVAQNGALGIASNSNVSSSGTLTINGAGATVAVQPAGANLTTNGGTATVNLLNGTLALNGDVTRGTRNSGRTPGTVSFTLGGGTLRPYDANLVVGSSTAANTAAFDITLASNSLSTITGVGWKSGTSTVTVVSNIVGSGSLQFTGGTVVLSGSNTYTGNTTVNSGTLLLSNANALRGSTFAGGAGTLAFTNQGGDLFNNYHYLGGLSGTSNLSLLDTSGTSIRLMFGFNNANTTFSGNLTNAQVIEKLGTGTTTLSGNITTGLAGGAFSMRQGGVRQTGGTITLNRDNGSGAFTVGVGSGTTGSYVLESGTVVTTSTAGGHMRIGGGGSTGTLTINGSSARASFSGTNNTIGGNDISVSSGTGTINLIAGELAVNSLTTGTAAGSAGSFNFSGGTLRPYSQNASIGRSGSGFTIDLAGNSATFSGLDAAAGTARTLTILTTLVNGTSGAAGAIFSGGTVSLSAANTYSGATTIAGANTTLALGANGSFANSPTITVGNAGSSGAVLNLTAKTGTFSFTSGQTVGGIGTINIGSGKTVSSAGIWAPGNSIGSNAVTGNLTLTGTSQFELGTPGPSTSSPGTSDFTAVSGTLTLGGALTLLDNAGANGNGSAAGGVYRLFTYGNAVSGSYASVTANPTATTRTSLSQITYGGSGTAAGQGVFLSLYNLASATSAQTVNLGNTRVGTALTGSVTIANLAPLNATFTETLSTGSFSATTSGFTTSGSASNIAGGGSGSGNLLVGLGTGLSAGAQSGTTTLALFSNAVNSSGLAQQSIASQTITITGTVWNLGTANTISPVTLGNIRAGSAFGTGPLSIQNTAVNNGFSEGLTATVVGVSGSATSSGSVGLLAAGGTSTAITLGLGNSAYTVGGSYSGTASIQIATNGQGTSGLGTLVTGTQSVGVSGTVWNYAAASILSGTTVNFGTVLKNTPLSQSLSISNTAVANGFSEGLGAAFGAATGQAGGSGSWSLLSAGGTSTALSVTLASGSAGVASGAQTLNFTSDGAGTSGLSAASIGSQTVNLTATVLDPALASFASGSTATSLLLDFGSVNQNASVSPLGFSLFNLMQTSGYTADLALMSIDQTDPTGPLSTNLSLFNTLLAGGSNAYTASFSTATLGSFSNVYTLTFKSSNASTPYASDTPQTLTLTVTGVIAVPEPGAIALAGIGIAAAAYALRRRK